MKERRSQKENKKEPAIHPERKEGCEEVKKGFKEFPGH